VAIIAILYKPAGAWLVTDTLPLVPLISRNDWLHEERSENENMMKIYT